jgi:adhesin transport system membrane fusion protein
MTKKKQETIVEEVKAEKVEPAAAKKSGTKYHFSVNLTPEKLEDAVHAAETPREPFDPKKKKEKEEEKQIHFPKEAKAVHQAETPTEKNVQHIKYSEQDRQLLPSDEASKPATVEEIKKSIATLKSDPKAFRELQNFVRPSMLTVTKKALEKRVSLKYWNHSLITIMKGVDSFIGFITKPSGQGRNEAVQKARSPILFGIWVCFIFFVIFGTWAALAPLDQSTHAMGYIVTSSKKQIIQNREGGILEAIYVKEGDHVKIDQPLAKLTDSQTTPQLRALYTQKEGAEKQLKILEEQLKAYKDLAAKGFIALAKVHEVESREIQASAQLGDINAKLESVENISGRLTLKSSVNGIVTQINVNTIGGTVGQGQSIMTITPTEEELILEAYVQAKNIEPVHVGLKAKVNVIAFQSKTTSHLDGIVTYVSPDVVDFVQSNGTSTQEASVLNPQRGVFYKIRVSIDKSQLKKISKEKDYALAPGMEADVQIAVGERTLLQYLLSPILGSFWNALKEK